MFPSVFSTVFTLVLLTVNSSKGGEQFPSLLEYTDRHEQLVFPSVLLIVNNAIGGQQFPLPLKYTDRQQNIGVSICDYIVNDAKWFLYFILIHSVDT
jgi:hypothetical protein